MLRTWGRRALIGLLLVLVGWATWPALQLLGYVLDDLALDDVAVAIALDWRDFGEAAAQERLSFELDRLGVSDRLPSDACALRAEAGGARAVRCAWTVGLALPGLRPVPLSFGSEARVTAAGELSR